MKIIKPLEELAESLKEHIVKEMQAEIEALKEALQAVITISDRKHDAWDKAKELLK
jgi:hypothetical protein